ncbi:LptA/OstA family protein [Pseudomonadota bacterium]
MSAISMLASHFSMAQAENSLNIKAFTEELTSNSDHTVYRKDVNIEIDVYSLKADEVSVFKKNGQADRILAKGSPLVFQHKDKKAKGFAKVEATELEYLVSDKKLNIKNYILVLGDGTTQRGKQLSFLLK